MIYVTIVVSKLQKVISSVLGLILSLFSNDFCLTEVWLLLLALVTKHCTVRYCYY